MAKKPKRKAPAKSQRERFIETARAIGIDESNAEFERALKKIIRPRRQAPSRS